MRCSGGTYFGLALSVVARTKSRTAFFAGPFFQEGSGSACVPACGCAWAGESPVSRTCPSEHRPRVVSNTSAASELHRLGMVDSPGSRWPGHGGGYLTQRKL